jgi:NAD(P)H-dependent FMN reductase
MTPLTLKLIVGSTRTGRRADLVAPWVARRATIHGAFDVEVLDLRRYPLPMFGEDTGTDHPAWETPAVRAWNAVIAEADAYVVITPEYNHSVPAVLKNAIDNVFGSHAFRNKVAGFVGYSAGRIGGARAVEHLAHVAIEAELVPLRNAVLIGQVHETMAGGAPADPGTDAALDAMLDDLAWWGWALRAAREAGELPPVAARRAAA